MRTAKTWQEWIAKATPHVRERLLRYNGDDGPKEGYMIRGWRPTQTEVFEQSLMAGRIRIPCHKAKYFLSVKKIGQRHWVNGREAARLGYYK